MSTESNSVQQSAFLDVGFHSGVKAQVYHADPCPAPSLSSSMAALIIERSPAHARLSHPKLCSEYVPRVATDGMNFGSVGHELLLGTGGGIAVFDGDSWRGKEATAFKAAAELEGKTPIKRGDYELISKCCESARAQMRSMGLGYALEEGRSEEVAIWKHRGQYMRAMFDRWIPERGEVWDLKFTGKSAHPHEIQRTITNMAYDLRSEFYLIGASALTGIPARKGGLGYQFLFIETEPPFCVTPCFLPESLRIRGKNLAQEAMGKFCDCMESGIWPGYVTSTVEIESPSWVEHEIADSITGS